MIRMFNNLGPIVFVSSVCLTMIRLHPVYGWVDQSINKLRAESSGLVSLSLLLG